MRHLILNFVATTQELCVDDCLEWLGELKIVGTAHDHRNGRYFIVVEAPLDCNQNLREKMTTKKVSRVKVPHQNAKHRTR